MTDSTGQSKSRFNLTIHDGYDIEKVAASLREIGFEPMDLLKSIGVISGTFYGDATEIEKVKGVQNVALDLVKKTCS